MNEFLKARTSCFLASLSFYHILQSVLIPHPLGNQFFASLLFKSGAANWQLNLSNGNIKTDNINYKPLLNFT